MSRKFYPEKSSDYRGPKRSNSRDEDGNLDAKWDRAASGLGNDERKSKFMRLMGGGKAKEKKSSNLTTNRKLSGDGSLAHYTVHPPGDADCPEQPPSATDNIVHLPDTIDYSVPPPGFTDHAQGPPVMEPQQPAPSGFGLAALHQYGTEGGSDAGEPADEYLNPQPPPHLEPPEKIEVETANKWEESDLGDEHRKNRFLRLMGAAKKSHTGKVVIGSSHGDNGRSQGDIEKATRDLEDQFQQGLDNRFQRPRHAGLGFGDEEAKEDEDPWEKWRKVREPESSAADSEQAQRDRDPERGRGREGDRPRDLHERDKGRDHRDRDLNRDRRDRHDRDRHDRSERHDRDHKSDRHYDRRDRDRHDHRDRHSSGGPHQRDHRDRDRQQDRWSEEKSDVAHQGEARNTEPSGGGASSQPPAKKTYMEMFVKSSGN